MSRTGSELFDEALFHLGKARSHATGDLSQEIVLDAIAMRLAAMIDTLNRLPDEVLIDCFGEAWPLMRGMRNRIVHGYAAISTSAVLITVTEDLPGVEMAIHQWLEQHPNS